MSLFKQMAGNVPFAINAGATFVLLFSFASPLTFALNLITSYYLGNITPNVSHNSTTIFLMPFAQGAFILQAHDLKRNETRFVVASSVLPVVGILIKPSFFFAYAPATALWVALNFGHTKRRFLAEMPLLIEGVMTAFIYTAVYHLQQGSIHDAETGLTLSRLSVWIYFFPKEHIPISLICSFLAPILFPLLGLRPARSAWMNYVSSLMAAGLMLLALVAETGAREIQ